MAATPKVLLIGGTGYLGRHVLALLDGRDDLFLSVMCRNVENVPRHITALSGNVHDADRLEELLYQHDAVICLAPLGENGGKILTQACHRSGVTRLVLVTDTESLYTPNPRRRGLLRDNERALMNSELDWTLLRPCLMYGGEDDTTSAAILDHFAHHKILLLPGYGSRYIQPVHVEDVAQAVVAAFFAQPTFRRTYGLSGPVPVTLRQYIKTLARKVGRKAWAVGVPAKLARYALPIYSKLVYTPQVVAFLGRLANERAQDHAMATRHFGFMPRPLGAGFKTLPQPEGQ